MEIVSANDGLLLDMEAYGLLKGRSKQRRQANGGTKPAKDARMHKSLAKHRDWVERECIKHLQDGPAGGETPGGVKSFLAALKAFGAQRGPQAELTLAETMQLVNLRPTAPVEVHLVVEECADRLSDEDVDALCELVATHLGASEGMEVAAESAAEASSAGEGKK